MSKGDLPGRESTDQALARGFQGRGSPGNRAGLAPPLSLSPSPDPISQDQEKAGQDPGGQEVRTASDHVPKAWREFRAWAYLGRASFSPVLVSCFPSFPWGVVQGCHSLSHFLPHRQASSQGTQTLGPSTLPWAFPPSTSFLLER